MNDIEEAAADKPPKIMAPSEKPHISPSQLSTYARCPAQYERRYIRNEIIPPGIALMKGKAFHAGNKVNMRQKIESHQDLAVKEIQEIAAEAFNAEVAGGYVLTQEEQSQGVDTVLGDAKDKTVQMAGFYAKEQAPDYQPVLVEQRIRIELPMCSHDMLGILDLADDKDRVTDFKTAQRRKNQKDADTNMGLTVYGASFKAIMGREPSEFRLDSVIQGKKFMARDLLVSQRTARDYDVLANRTNAVLAAIKAGSFPPTDPGSWACSVKFCGYARTCPYFNAEREQAGESS